jgi:hypothetical protein
MEQNFRGLIKAQARLNLSNGQKTVCPLPCLKLRSYTFEHADLSRLFFHERRTNPNRSVHYYINLSSPRSSIINWLSDCLGDCNQGITLLSIVFTVTVTSFRPFDGKLLALLRS